MKRCSEWGGGGDLEVGLTLDEHVDPVSLFLVKREDQDPVPATTSLIRKGSSPKPLV